MLAEADADGLSVADAAEGAVLMLGRQQPGLLMEVVQLCWGLLRRGFPVPCWSFPW